MKLWVLHGTYENELFSSIHLTEKGCALAAIADVLDFLSVDDRDSALSTMRDMYAYTPDEKAIQGSKEPFEWDQVHAVVTFNSSITIKALHNGVPCFSNFENPCGEICESDFTKIETPMYADREPVFHSLAYGQFTQEEFRNG